MLLLEEPTTIAIRFAWFINQQILFSGIQIPNKEKILETTSAAMQYRTVDDMPYHTADQLQQVFIEFVDNVMALD